MIPSLDRKYNPRLWQTPMPQTDTNSITDSNARRRYRHAPAPSADTGYLRVYDALEALGRCIRVDFGWFACAECGVVGKPIGHNDRGHTFIKSSDCRHIWGSWKQIEAALDKEDRS